MIISFAYTEKEFMTELKTVTRRNWSAKYFNQWVKAWDEGRLIHDGWSKSPRAGGRFLSKFKLTNRPYLEKLKDMPPEDLVAEGGMCKTLDEFCQLVDGEPEDIMTVIRFVKINS
jgi:hypothetical protein